MVCYFFGTFNPPHLGHVAVAKSVKEEFGFEKVIFVPSPNPPHKETLNPYQKLEMARLAFGDENVSDIEYNMPDTSYSYKTIQKLGKCSFIIGYDAFLEIENWKHPEILKEMLEFIVVPRKNGQDDSKIKVKFEDLKKMGYNFKIANFKPVDISSSKIREDVAKGLDITEFVDEKVKEYIYGHGLYKNLA
jgi:nicotinate-nucleotide adenylyltransferase